MGKAKSPKRVGIVDQVTDAYDSAKTAVKDFFTPDKGTLAEKLKNRDKVAAETVKKQAPDPAKPKKVSTAPKYKPGSNPLLRPSQDTLTRAQAEKIRANLQAKKKAKAKKKAGS